MKNFKQTYRTILSLFFLGIFLSVFVVDVSCFIGQLDFSETMNDEHNHSHHSHHNHEHDSHSKIKSIDRSSFAVIDSDCCIEETLGFYSSVSKVVVSKSLNLYHPIKLIEAPIFHFEIVDQEIELSKLTSICNKAPPPKIERIYLLIETFII